MQRTSPPPLEVNPKKLSPLWKKVVKRPTEDRVHNLRVLTRKIRAKLWLGLADEDRKVKKSEKGLKEVGKALGKVRTLDVAMKDAKSYGIKAEKLKKQRKKNWKKIKKDLSKNHLNKLKKRLDKAEKAFKKLSVDEYQKQLRKIAERLDEYREKLPASKEDWHDARIALKKARYTLQAFGKRPATLEKVQDELGRWHDLETLTDLVDKAPAKLKRDAESALQKGKEIFPAAVEETRTEIEKLSQRS